MEIETIIKKHKSVLKSYKDSKIKKDNTFNLFFLISNQYYKENLHSDILAALLNPNGEHKQGSFFLQAFLEYLNSIGASIHINDYVNSIVQREKGRIDICIKSENKHAIIIENKINNAVDMNGQIPRYYLKIKGQDCIIDCVLYLTIDGLKMPDTSTWVEKYIGSPWSDKQSKELNEMIFSIGAYNGESDDIYNGYLKKLLPNLMDDYCKAVIRQYMELLNKLGENNMNNESLEKLYKDAVSSNNYKDLVLLHDMVEQMPLFRLKKYISLFKNSKGAFKKIDNWQNWIVFFHQFGNGTYHNLKIHIIPKQKETDVEVFEQNNTNKENVEMILREIEEINNLNYVSGSKYTKTFAFPEEEGEMIEYTKQLIEKLTNSTLNQ